MLARILNVIVVLVLVLPFGGCYSYAPVKLKVLDANSTKPIEGAKVQIGYLVYLHPFPPRVHEGVTDKTGQVILPVALNAPPAVADASALGYFPATIKVFADYPNVPYQSVPEFRIQLEKQPLGGN